MTDRNQPSPAALGSLGADAITVPAFFVTHDNAADLLRWKSEHPDWFEAGTWSGGSAIDQPQHGRTPTPGLRAPEDYAVNARPMALPDPSTLSVRAFEDAAAASGSLRQTASPPRAATPAIQAIALHKIPSRLDE